MGKRGPAKGTGGRPSKQINIDQKQFESLCALQCTEEEMCGFFGVNTDTINSWCKNTYGETFSETFKKKSAGGKMSLRRSQFRLAEKSATMAIWLGKQYLGQRDIPDVVVALGNDDDGFISALTATIEDDWNGSEDDI